jgi:hypothetical protein
MAIRARGNPDGYFRRTTFLKKLFWAYFLLLIFEGALRKWVVPQLSAPLLIVRDPVAILIIWEAYRTHKWPMRWSAVIALGTVLFLGLFGLQMIVGDNPLIVGLYGLRSYLLPLPVIFIIGENLDDDDLRHLGACTLFLMLPMTLLEVAQYVAPSSSFLNVGAYEGGSQIGYVREHVRSSGTFSFAIGVVHFDTLVAAFIFCGIVRQDFVKKWMLWASAFALIISIPTTGARTLITQLAGVIGCVGLAAVMGISEFGRLLRAVVPIAILAVVASELPVFSDAMKSMTDRFSSANATEGGGSAGGALFDRTVQPAVNAFEAAASSNKWTGIGMGQGAAAMAILLNGNQEYLAGEDEFSRELVEMGPIAGSLVELFKVFLAIALFGSALSRARTHDPLSLLMFPLTLSALFFGVLEQPTIQGFCVIGAGFCIAAARSTQGAEQVLPFAVQRALIYRPRMQQELTRRLR